MRIGSDDEFIEITGLEKAPQHLPSAGDVRVSVQVKLKEFAGRYDSVWLEEPVLKDFIDRMESNSSTCTRRYGRSDRNQRIDVATAWLAASLPAGSFLSHRVR